jgi:hypothetical protein
MYRRYSGYTIRYTVVVLFGSSQWLINTLLTTPLIHFVGCSSVIPRKASLYSQNMACIIALMS